MSLTPNETVLLKIQEKLQDPCYQVKIRKLPDYLANFLKEYRDVIFIYKQGTKSSKFEASSRFKDSRSSIELNEASFIGTPLEAPSSDFDHLNLTYIRPLNKDPSEADSNFPLSLNKARCLASLCSVELKPQLPVWMLTDGSDFKRTVLLSLEVAPDGWVTTGWATLGHPPAEPICLEDLLASYVTFSKLPALQVQCKIGSSYLIRKVSHPDEPSERSCSVYLHTSWSTLCLEPPIDRSTEVIIDAGVRVGESSGSELEEEGGGGAGLRLLWEQIKLLDELLNMAADRAHHLPVHLPSSASLMLSLGECRAEPPLSRVRQVLREPVRAQFLRSSQVAGGGAAAAGGGGGGPDLSSLIATYTAVGAPGSGLTDRLWLLLIQCKNYQELSDCWKEIIKEHEKRHSTFVCSSNMTSFGRALSGESHAGIHDPLDNLIEMGLEKLRKELLLIFSNAGIASGNSLNVPKCPNFSEISVPDWLPTARKWHTWLCQIYSALEILWNVQVCLMLPREGLCFITPHILQYFTAPSSKIQSFASLLQNPFLDVKVYIPVEHVKNALVVPPDEWVFTLTTATNFKKTRCTFFRTNTNLFPNVINKEDYTFSDNSTYWYEFRSISDLFGK